MTKNLICYVYPKTSIFNFSTLLIKNAWTDFVKENMAIATTTNPMEKQ